MDTGKPASGEGQQAQFDQQGTCVLRDLDQLRLLADPLRLRLIHAFAKQPRTTKQVAESLGLPATRLYHHVGQLEEAGLLRLTGTRPVRGTVEKYYQTVARRFVAAPGVFAGEGAGGSARELGLHVLDQARADLAALTPADADAADCAPVIARATVLAPMPRMRELRARLLEWLAEIEAFDSAAAEEANGGNEAADGGDAEDSPAPGGEAAAYALTLAFLPTERPG